MSHTWHKCSDENDASCFVCSGDLCLCTVCGGAEGSLPTHCPGYRMSELQHDLVYAGRLDYRDNNWVDETGEPL